MKAGAQKQLGDSGIVVASALLFAVANVAYRYGNGSSFVLAAQRALIGALLFAPYTVRAWRNGGLRKILTDRAAMVGIICSAATMPASALMFRTLSGPQAGLRLAIGPAILVLITVHTSTVGRRWSLIAVFISVVAAVGAVVDGGLGPVSVHQVWPAGLNLALDLISIVALEKARERHSATALVGSAMVAATIGCTVLALIFVGESAPPLSGLVAATVVGVCGTIARALRAYVLPSLGAAVAFSSVQVTSFATAIGGVIIFADDLSLLSAILGTIAAIAAVVAAWQAPHGLNQ